MKNVPPWFNWFLITEKISFFSNSCQQNCIFPLFTSLQTISYFLWLTAFLLTAFLANQHNHLFPRESLNQWEFSILSENKKKTFSGASQAGGTFAIACLPLSCSTLYFAPYKFFTRLSRRLWAELLYSLTPSLYLRPRVVKCDESHAIKPQICQPLLLNLCSWGLFKPFKIICNLNDVNLAWPVIW